MWQHSKATLFFLKKELYGKFQWIEFKCLNPVQSFQGDTLVLATKSLGLSGTLLIDLTMKPTSGFELANPRLVIGKHVINSLLHHSNKAINKIFKI